MEGEKRKEIFYSSLSVVQRSLVCTHTTRKRKYKDFTNVSFSLSPSPFDISQSPFLFLLPVLPMNVYPLLGIILLFHPNSCSNSAFFEKSKGKYSSALLWRKCFGFSLHACLPQLSIVNELVVVISCFPPKTVLFTGWNNTAAGFLCC